MPPKPEIEPARGGTRGGLENFKWDSLKQMSRNEREHYLGASVKLTENDWLQKAKKLKKTKEELAEEKERIKKEEELRMNEALGISKSTKLKKEEIQQLPLSKKRKIN
jgi:Multiple myeloma tumor-associated